MSVDVNLRICNKVNGIAETPSVIIISRVLYEYWQKIAKTKSAVKTVKACGNT